MKTTHLIISTKCDLMCIFSLSLSRSLEAIGKNLGGGLDRILLQPNFTSLVVDPLKVCNSKICHMGMDVYRFIYAFMAGGIFTLLVTCTGHVAAETSNSFCLSCVSYSTWCNFLPFKNSYCGDMIIESLMPWL
jgi:hypothetical protein